MSTLLYNAYSVIMCKTLFSQATAYSFLCIMNFALAHRFSYIPAELKPSHFCWGCPVNFSNFTTHQVINVSHGIILGGEKSLDSFGRVLTCVAT